MESVEEGNTRAGAMARKGTQPLSPRHIDLTRLPPPFFSERCEEPSGLLAFLPEEISPQECWSPPHPWTLPQGPHLPLRSLAQALCLPCSEGFGIKCCTFLYRGHNGAPHKVVHKNDCLVIPRQGQKEPDGERGHRVRTGYSVTWWGAWPNLRAFPIPHPTSGAGLCPSLPHPPLRRTIPSRSKALIPEF